VLALYRKGGADVQLKIALSSSDDEATKFLFVSVIAFRADFHK